MATVAQLLDLCQKTYEHSAIEAGVDRINGANVFTLSNDETVIVFRGTLANHDLQSALDWLADAHAELVRADGFPGRVHRGFLDALNSLWDGVIDELEGHGPPPTPSTPNGWWQRFIDWIAGPPILADNTVPPPLPWNKKVCLTGHSKGGALATLAAVRLAALRPRVVVFGSPMAGDMNFAADYPNAIDLLRLENDGDLVPFLPGRMLGYREVGVCWTPTNMPRMSREAKVGKLLAEGKWEQVKANHHLENYRWSTDDPPSTPTAEAV